MPRRRSSARLSVWVVPESTDPGSSSTPARCRSRSVRVVLPASTWARTPRFSDGRGCASTRDPFEVAEHDECASSSHVAASLRDLGAGPSGWRRRYDGPGGGATGFRGCSFPWAARRVPDHAAPSPRRPAAGGRPGDLAGAVLRPGLRLHHHPAHRDGAARRLGGDRAVRTAPADPVVDVRRLRLAHQRRSPGDTPAPIAARPRDDRQLRHRDGDPARVRLRPHRLRRRLRARRPRARRDVRHRGRPDHPWHGRAAPRVEHARRRSRR